MGPSLPCRRPNRCTPCPLRACRWPFAVGFATTGYIFVKIGLSVTGARRSPPPSATAESLAPTGVPPLTELVAGRMPREQIRWCPLLCRADEDVKQSKFVNPRH